MCLLVPSLSWNWDASLIHKISSNNILKTFNKCEDNLIKIDNKFIKCEVGNNITEINVKMKNPISDSPSMNMSTGASLPASISLTLPAIEMLSIKSHLKTVSVRC